jgi:YbbR domain-containing protein
MQFATLKKRIDFDEIKRRLTRNVGLRLLALGIAIGFWMFVNAGERGSVASLTVPLSYRQLPPGFVIVNRPPDFVKIEVTGPRTLLSLLDPERIAVRLMLNGIGNGQSDIRILPTMFNTPRGTMVTRISPDLITLDVDHIMRRDVPVHLTTQGKTSNGYTVSAVDVRPATVTVTGPSRFVLPLTQINTEPFDIDGLTSDIERSVDLADTESAIRYEVDSVDAKVSVSEVIADREFRSVGVDVQNCDYRFRVEPRAGSIIIRGPMLKLESLETKGLLFVDAKDLEPGSHELPVQVNLPDGMQLVRETPDKVRLRMYHDRRVTSADEHPS